jgi:hypothetical protein
MRRVLQIKCKISKKFKPAHTYPIELKVKEFTRYIDKYVQTCFKMFKHIFLTNDFSKMSTIYTHTLTHTHTLSLTNTHIIYNHFSLFVFQLHCQSIILNAFFSDYDQADHLNYLKPYSLSRLKY